MELAKHERKNIIVKEMFQVIILLVRFDCVLRPIDSEIFAAYLKDKLEECILSTPTHASMHDGFQCNQYFYSYYGFPWQPGFSRNIAFSDCMIIIILDSCNNKNETIR
jgi:hypothetical protein